MSNKVTLIPTSNNALNKSFLKLTFLSIFNPACLVNLRLLCSSNSISNAAQFKFKKILVKQSYLLLFWAKSASLDAQPKITFLPRKKLFKYTKTKSPMAQKTYSQEQFTFQIYKYTFSKLTLSAVSNMSALNFSTVLYFFTKVRSRGSFHGTNFLFVHRTSLSTLGSDALFFEVS